MSAEVPLALNFGQARASVGSGGNVVNLYAQSTPTGARSDVVLLGAPGTRLWKQLTYVNLDGVTVNETGLNAMIYVKAWDKILIVGDHAMYFIAQNGLWTRTPSVGMQAPVSLAYNRADVAAVNGTLAYWVNEAGVVTIESADSDFEMADSCTFQDGYVIFNRKFSGQVFCTGLYTRAINALDFAEAEKAPDNAIGVLSAGDLLYVFGDDTTEVWFNAANATGFPFSRQDGSVMEHGCASVATARQFDGAVFWLTAAGLVIMASGGAPSRISDDQVEAALKDRRADWSTASAFVYSDEGHTFYQLTVGDLTLVYDLATQFWHQRANYSRGHALPRCYVNAWGRHYVGDDTGRILELTTEAYDDAGEPLVAEIVSMPYQNSRLYSAIGSLELMLDAGLSPAGADYGVLMQISADGGRTWSTSRRQGIGLTGQRKARVRWSKLGARLDHRFKFRISDPFRRAILSVAQMVA